MVATVSPEWRLTPDTDNRTIAVFEVAYSWTHFYIVSVFLGFLIFCIICGNALVVLAVLTERHLRVMSNYLILSLAVADLLVAVIVMPLSLVHEVSKVWWLGLVEDKISKLSKERITAMKLNQNTSDRMVIFRIHTNQSRKYVNLHMNGNQTYLQRDTTSDNLKNAGNIKTVAECSTSYTSSFAQSGGVVKQAVPITVVWKANRTMRMCIDYPTGLNAAL
ncbi:unnamed protein product [Hymenolepis diminuta]|uniref:G_PROTEIN_RECEP_F1_2 domain-containing protein n=1 Tax=Hymenolepis diminuta TaxID=6216 RepID=A0A0R3SYJ7_HYMDI|nr:unnamed protein product [Hymenolepis diminuta]